MDEQNNFNIGKEDESSVEIEEKKINPQQQNFQNIESDENNEKIINEIRYDIDDSKDTLKYDISEKNENSFINNVMGQGIKNIILDDKEIRDKNNVKNILIRFIFTNAKKDSKIIIGKIKKSNTLKELNKLNSFLPDFIKDKVNENSYQNFYNIYRINIDLPFLEFDDIILNISMDY